MTTTTETRPSRRRPAAHRRDAGPLRRAGADVRPRQRVLHRGLRGAARPAATSLASLPAEFGGAGLNLAEINRLQRRIAYVAPATAVAVNMHHYFVGLCADLHRAGDPSGDWVLRKAAEGHVFAAGHGEAGNDIPVLLSSSTAERVDGGWEITGHKIFGSLSPVWTYLGVHAHGHQRSGQPARSSTASCTATRRATASRRRGTRSACGRRRRTTRSSTARSCPTRRSILVCPAGFAGAGTVPRRPVRLGAARVRRRLLVDRPAGLRRHRRPACTSGRRGAHPLDGLPPRGAAPRRRDAHPPRSDDRPPRPGVRRLGRTASTTAWTGR